MTISKQNHLEGCGIRLFSAASRGFLAAIVCAGIASGLSAQKVSFPGARSEARSPDGRFVVKNSDSDGQEAAYTLTLIDRRNGSATKIYSYDRSVDILWSSTSRAFIVNDHEGSNASHPVLFTAPWVKQPVDLLEKLTSFLHSGRGASSVLHNHHVYFLAQRWVSEDEILCQVTGYGEVDPNGFSAKYVYKIGAGFRRPR